MALHYMVISDISLTNGRPSLVGLSLHSTKAGCTLWPLSGSVVRFTSNKRIFATKQAATTYINHLLGRFPNSLADFPVLDRGQQELFQGVSK